MLKMPFQDFEKTTINRNNVGFLLAKASQRWNELLHDEFCKANYQDLRPSYGSILVPLYEKDGLCMGDLGKRAGLSKQAMTTMIRHIQAKGFIATKADPHDKRMTRVYLTAKGRAAQNVARKAIARIETNFLKNINDNQVNLLRDALIRLIQLNLEGEKSILGNVLCKTLTRTGEKYGKNHTSHHHQKQ